MAATRAYRGVLGNRANFNKNASQFEKKKKREVRGAAAPRVRAGGAASRASAALPLSKLQDVLLLGLVLGLPRDVHVKNFLIEFNEMTPTS